MPGLAGGLPADRAARPVQLLRGVRAHRRLDVQPAREMAVHQPRTAVAAADRVAELPTELPCVAPGPQRRIASGSRVHRPGRQQACRGGAGLPAAGRQHAAVGGRPLPAQPRLRQRHRRRQAARAVLPVDGRRDRALHPRAGHLAVGQHGDRRARRGAGLRRGRPDAGDAGRRRHPASRTARPARCGWSTSST